VTRALRYGALAATGALVLACMVLTGDTPGGGTGGPAPPLPLSITGYPVPPGALFVATDGADSAAGTRRAPLRTVAAAVKRARPGATIVVRAGTYRETVGRVSKRITLQPYPGERVWLKGSVVVSGWKRSAGGWRHEGWAANLCRTCFLDEIIDPAHPLAGLPDMAFLDGRPLRQVATAGELGPGTFFADRPGRALLVGDDPNGRLLEATAFDRLLQFDSTEAAGSVLRGIGIAQYGTNQDYGNHGAMVVVNAANVTIENSTFAWSASSGVAVFQPGAVLTGNTFTGNGLVGMVANRADDLRMTGNTFSGNNQERFTLTGEAIGAAGAKLTRTKRPYVADNAFVDNIGSGWWCDLGCTDATVLRNVARGNAVNGLYYEVSSRALIASNVVAGNRARGLKISSSDHVRVYHNTFENNGITIGIYNDKRNPDSDSYSVQNGVRWLTSGTVLVNNFYAQSEARNPIIESADYKAHPDADPAFVARSDNNVYLRPRKGRPGPLVSWSAGAGKTAEYGSLGEFSAATGCDRAGVEADATAPVFRDPATGDYALRPGAPGIGAAAALPADVAAALGVSPAQRRDLGALR
jgi:parallel beta-helix repeat protein